MRRLVGYTYDAETADYWPLYEEDGKLYGFPNSSYDGTPAGDIALVHHGFWCIQPDSGSENGSDGVANTV